MVICILLLSVYVFFCVKWYVSPEIKNETESLVKTEVVFDIESMSSIQSSDSEEIKQHYVIYINENDFDQKGPSSITHV